jgi:hypothetical protein
VALRAERVKVFERAVSVKLRSSPRTRGPRALKTGCPLSRARTDIVQDASIRNDELAPGRRIAVSVISLLPVNALHP